MNKFLKPAFAILLVFQCLMAFGPRAFAVLPGEIHTSEMMRENANAPADDQPNYSIRDENYKYLTNPEQVGGEKRKISIVLLGFVCVALLFVITASRDFIREKCRERKTESR